jgi:uncharacterized protein YegJ (DUF2314 family)
MKIYPLALALCAFLLTGCNSPSPEGSVVKREDGQQDVILVKKQNDKMNTAIAQARQTVPQFIQSLQHPKASQKGFIVKLPITDGKNTEHMWMSHVTFDGKELQGKLVDDAYEVQGYKTGQTVRIAPDKITDWAYGEDGKMVGGYTNIVVEEMQKK